jgi:hypothetical protein
MNARVSPALLRRYSDTNNALRRICGDCSKVLLTLLASRS